MSRSAVHDLLQAALVNLGSAKAMLIVEDVELPIEVSAMLDTVEEDIEKAIAVLREDGN
jgi:hypothetical protein